MRRLWLGAVGLLGALLLLTLLGGQSYREGVAMICAVPSSSGARDQAPAQASTTIAVYLQENLTNPRAQALWRRILWADPLEKQALLDHEAKAVGLASCEILDLGG